MLTALLMTALCVNVSAEVYGGDCGADGDNVTWSLDTETGVLSITGTGEMADYSSGGAPWYSYTYRSSVKTVEIGEGITRIGKYAFYNARKHNIQRSKTAPARVPFLHIKQGLTARAYRAII